MSKRKLVLCFFGIIICLAVGIIAGWITKINVEDWYPTINKPGFTPPAYAFGPVWTVLYILMGTSLGLVLGEQHSLKGRASIFFVIQLFFNALWSFIFFEFHQLKIALIDLGLIITFLGIAIYYFYKVKPLAALLMLPYFSWTSFAFAINAAIINLN